MCYPILHFSSSIAVSCSDGGCGGLEPRFRVSFFMEVLSSSIFFIFLVVGKGSTSSISSIVAGQGLMEDTMEESISYPILHPVDLRSTCVIRLG